MKTHRLAHPDKPHVCLTACGVLFGDKPAIQATADPKKVTCKKCQKAKND